ncbi:MAG: UDP-glucose 6-dehydrogenase, partial [Clostridiales bacterium]|nr:UDP-glucose 6-dehydrogenase [Clostridiales bacterium]
MGGYTIAVAGAGYVGLANAILLAQHNRVTAVDIAGHKVDMINAGQSPILDDEVQQYLSAGGLDLTGTTDGRAAYAAADLVVVSTPTDYDPRLNHFDTSSVESVIEQVAAVNRGAAIVVKSTVPVGFTEAAAHRYGARLLFSPEFLREGRALYDNLHPSRIVVGSPKGDTALRDVAAAFAELLIEGAIKKDAPVRLTDLAEAEAVKLFANTYLALRVA